MHDSSLWHSISTVIPFFCVKWKTRNSVFIVWNCDTFSLMKCISTFCVRLLNTVVLNPPGSNLISPKIMESAVTIENENCGNCLHEILENHSSWLTNFFFCGKFWPSPGDERALRSNCGPSNIWRFWSSPQGSKLY